MSWISFKPLITWMIALFHPFFISVIDIQHNNKEAALEISVRTFTDDLEKMINKEYHVQIDLNDPKQKTKADALVKQYIQQKIALNTNGVKLNVYCELLFGIDPQQINIFHVTSGGNRKSYELAAPKNSTQFIF